MGATPLQLADALSKPQCILNVNSFTLNGLSPLHVAAIRDDALACRLRINAGAHVDGSHPASGQTTSLHKACERENYLAAHALVSLGASTTLKDDTGFCAMSHIASSLGPEDTRLPQLVFDYGGDIHSVTDAGVRGQVKWTPLLGD
ncbi:hypothetical protein B0T25DRAFT_602923 [Lasiosphaeria hispida]|uniref:Ankyrin n=1 Tax=Lasiosphaeria hispida TaxID=260671 RepID=A0AAJ0HKA1_9PEZI|nr:hypothetical protein B0T25DRAFT_602923 [Lasiosphaeria hispida]